LQTLCGESAEGTAQQVPLIVPGEDIIWSSDAGMRDIKLRKRRDGTFEKKSRIKQPPYQYCEML
jgi:hypothetical protein